MSLHVAGVSYLSLCNFHAVRWAFRKPEVWEWWRPRSRAREAYTRCTRCRCYGCCILARIWVYRSTWTFRYGCWYVVICGTGWSAASAASATSATSVYLILCPSSSGTSLDFCLSILSLLCIRFCHLDLFVVCHFRCGIHRCQCMSCGERQRIGNFHLGATQQSLSYETNLDQRWFQVSEVMGRYDANG